ncbi:MAG: Crp/Fnr family transcriptional regulator [Candidatus Thiodiazotropha sp.]
MADSELDKLNCFDKLEAVLDAYGLSQAEEREKVRPLCVERTYAKGENLLDAGEVADGVFFLCSGLVRFFYLTQDGREFNKSFSTESQFAGAIQSSHAPEPGRFYMQALEPTQTLKISLQGLQDLYRQSLPWANLGRLYMESLAVRKTRREAGFLLDSAEQRYRDFLQQEPLLVQRLPLYHIASFLGITDVALSRIRKRIG